jgi:site-specific recombinase XerD
MDVDRSQDVWRYRPASHKTEHMDRERVIFIGPHGQDVLRPYLLRAADAFCFSPAESEAKRHKEMRAACKSKIQPSQRNRRTACPKRLPADHYTKDSYARAIRRAVKKANKQIAKEAAEAGIKEPQYVLSWAPNQLRHSKATEVRRMFGLEAAQVTLGHAHARITEVYAERDTKLAADIARKIG